MTHYHSGPGSYGCLYDNGPHYTKDYASAVDSLVETFNLGRTRVSALKRDGHLDLNPRRDGADYCEITECHDECQPEDFE